MSLNTHGLKLAPPSVWASLPVRVPGAFNISYSDAKLDPAARDAIAAFAARRARAGVFAGAGTAGARERPSTLASMWGLRAPNIFALLPVIFFTALGGGILHCWGGVGVGGSAVHTTS